MHLEHAIGHQVEISPALPPIDGPFLLTFDDRESDRAPIFVIHSGIHCERDLFGPLSKTDLEIAEPANGDLVLSGSDELKPPFAGSADGEARTFEKP